MKVLVLGGGGREHALVSRLGESPLITQLYAWPGNDGMLREEKVELIRRPLGEEEDFAGLLDFCLTTRVDLVVVGPEQALGQGVVDRLQQSHIRILGPTKAAARLETSKFFAKTLMKEAGIPTAPFVSFSYEEEPLIRSFIDSSPWGEDMVVKVDSLAAGKGVVVASSRKEAMAAVDQLRPLGKRLVLEKKLKGREVSAFALCNGEEFVSLGFACDYKRIGDGDTGPNTGGMGAYSPVDWLGPMDQKRIEDRVFTPLLKMMKEKGHPFQGILFAGLMVDGEDFQVLEFNVRLGDPETQVLLPLMSEDLLPWFLWAADQGRSARPSAVTSLQGGKGKSALHAVHVVLAAPGYPAYNNADLHLGGTLDIQNGGPQSKIIFAGVKATAEGSLVTAGGRVLGVTAWGESKEKARAEAYQSVEKISFPGAQYRRDIGK